MVNSTIIVDVLALATSLPYVNQLQALGNSTQQVSFISYHPSFITDVLGSNATQKLVTRLSYAAFHEAGVYNLATGNLYATSNWAGSEANPINITAIAIHDDDRITSLRYPHVAEGNGGTAFYPVGTPANSSQGQAIVFCDEGDLDHASQLVTVDPATNASRVLLNNFYGRNFSSINDVKQHPVTGDLWFTDARYGLWQNFRPAAVIRPQVYRFEPATGVVQVVADDFIAPNGIEISPDFKHVYVTDTGEFTNYTDLTRPSTIYKYDITADGKRLENRSVFAYAPVGIPDGIHTDTRGNVYSAVGDGVSVWNRAGVLIGTFAVAGGSNNFAFVHKNGRNGMYIFNADGLFYVELKAQGRMVKRDFGL